MTTKKPVTPQVPALPGVTPLGLPPAPVAPLTGWRVGDAGLTVFGPKTDAPAPRVLLTGKDRAVVTLAAAAPDLLAVCKAKRERDGCDSSCYCANCAAVARAEGR